MEVTFEYDQPATLIATDNEGKQHWIGRKGRVQVADYCYFTPDENPEKKMLRTSLVAQVYLDDANVLQIRTNNSIYKFQL